MVIVHPPPVRGSAERYLARMPDRVAAHAPGLTDLVVGTDVLTPADLAAHNPNALRGDPYAGSAELDQNFLWRPLATAPGHATPVSGLWPARRRVRRGGAVSPAAPAAVSTTPVNPSVTITRRVEWADTAAAHLATLSDGERLQRIQTGTLDELTS